MPNIPQLRFQMLTSFSIILGVIILFGLATTLLTPQNISCRINSQADCPTEVQADLLLIVESRLLFNDIQKQIFALNSIKSRYEIVKLSKNVWGDITIVLNPLATAYSLKTNNALYNVTYEGTVLPTLEPPDTILQNSCILYFTNDNDLAQFVSEQTPLLSENQINQEVHEQMTAIIESLKSRQLKCLKIQPVNEQTWVIWLSTVDQIVINPAEIDSNLNRLSILLNSTLLTEERPANSYLDLRFSLPVLRNSL